MANFSMLINFATAYIRKSQSDFINQRNFKLEPGLLVALFLWHEFINFEGSFNSFI